MNAKLKYSILGTTIMFIFILFFNFFYISSKSSSEVNKIDTNKNVTMLTFDDGPGEADLKILKILNNNNIHATFFEVGCNLAKYRFSDKFEEAHPELKKNEESVEDSKKSDSITTIVQKILNSGNFIGNHTYNHQKYVNKISSLIDELKITNMLIKEVYKENLGVDISSSQIPVRMPYLQYFPGVEYALKQAGNSYIARGYLGTDYFEKEAGVAKILTQYETHLKKGIIFCCHSKDYAQEWLPLLIEYLRDKNYTKFATFWPKNLDSSISSFKENSYENYGRLVK
ncbi:polysaccharide deacetylase family protein [Spiroplasma endosymbiont of Aspidapion aeneum]|uniref:polysaccharide deacetylase family protein n=1 Tax=Spiroplasma endosymbiont of Aspidapion aeneum TaxID=3066276 RepID=UPI00313C24C9